MKSGSARVDASLSLLPSRAFPSFRIRRTLDARSLSLCKLRIGQRVLAIVADVFVRFAPVLVTIWNTHKFQLLTHLSVTRSGLCKNRLLESRHGSSGDLDLM